VYDDNDATFSAWPHLSESQRAVRALALGAALGLILSLLGRRR
jgi:hypothetical protein